MDEFRLKLFFYELLELSYNDLRPGWGNPCSYLLRDLIIRQKPFFDRIIGDYTGSSHEYRLNGAGLKMHWEVRKNAAGTHREFKCTISGDQAKEYPTFVKQARALILKHQFNKYPRFRNIS